MQPETEYSDVSAPPDALLASGGPLSGPLAHLRVGEVLRVPTPGEAIPGLSARAGGRASCNGLQREAAALPGSGGLSAATMQNNKLPLLPRLFLLPSLLRRLLLPLLLLLLLLLLPPLLCNTPHGVETNVIAKPFGCSCMCRVGMLSRNLSVRTHVLVHSH